MQGKEFIKYLRDICDTIQLLDSTNIGAKLTLTIIIASSYKLLLESQGYSESMCYFSNLSESLKSVGIDVSRELATLLDNRNYIAHTDDFNIATLKISKVDIASIKDEFDKLIKVCELKQRYIQNVDVVSNLSTTAKKELMSYDSSDVYSKEQIEPLLWFIEEHLPGSVKADITPENRFDVIVEYINLLK